MNGAEEDEEKKPKKKAIPPKKAPAAEKGVTEKKAPSKKRAAKKVFFIRGINVTLLFIFDRMQKMSPARTLLRILTISQLMTMMSSQRLKIRNERYVRYNDTTPSQRGSASSALSQRLPRNRHRRKQQNQRQVVVRRPGCLMGTKRRTECNASTCRLRYQCRCLSTMLLCFPIALCVLSLLSYIRVAVY